MKCAGGFWLKLRQSGGDGGLPFGKIIKKWSLELWQGSERLATDLSSLSALTLSHTTLRVVLVWTEGAYQRGRSRHRDTAEI